MNKQFTILIYLLLFSLSTALATDSFYKIDVKGQVEEACPCNCNKDNDLQVLREIYNNNGGANWILSSDVVYEDLLDQNRFKNVPNAGVPWDVNAPDAKDNMGAWHGVVTNQFGCVTDLILWSGPYNVDNRYNFSPQGIGLTGTLPTEIGDLCALEKLMIPHNDLTGPIPSSIEDLCSLEVLLFQNNNLSGPLPPEIGNLDNLLLLGLHYNDFSGSLPSSITNLDKLVIFHLKNNKLSGPLPSAIGNLENLLLMDLSDNCFSGTVPLSIVNVGNNSSNGGIFLGKVLAIWLQNNKLDSLPDISALQIVDNGIVDVSGNHLTFDDILPSLDVLTKYDNQTISLNQLYCAQVGDTLVIRPGIDAMIDAGNYGIRNTYFWSRPGTAYLDSSTLNVITFPGVSTFSAGNFSIGITNALAPDLRIEVTDLIVEVVEKAVIIGTFDVCANAGERYQTFNAGVGFDFTVEGGNIISEDTTSVTIQWGNTPVGKICATNRGTCSQTTCTTVNISPKVDVSILPPDILDCSKTVDTLEGATNLNNISFSWLTGQGTLIADGSSLLEVNTPGDYILEATDEIGCKGRDTAFVIEQIDEFQVNITGEPTFCEDDNTILGVTNNFSSYRWSTGETSNSIEVSNSGQYLVTVTNSNNCTATSAITVQTLDIPPSVITKSGDLDCSNKEVQLLSSIVSNSLTCVWKDTNGNLISTDKLVTVSNPGIYTLEVTNQNGCSNTDQIEVIKDESVVIPLISGTTSLCEGATGQLQVDENYTSYVWSTGATSATLPINDSVLVYSVTVTDISGCSGSNTVTIDKRSKPLVAIGGQTELCKGSSTSLVAFGDNTITNYNWSTGATTFETTISTAGIYTLTITDEKSCTNVASVEVIEASPINPTIIGENSFCKGSATSLQVDQIPNATYAWSTGQTSPLISAEVAGVYSVTITDAKNCSGTATIEVTESILPSPTIIGENTICAQGSTVLEVSQNFSEYTWSNGASAKSITVNEPGTYTVTVKDQFGCRNEASLEVIGKTTITPQIIGDLSLCGNESVTLSSQSTYASYTWSTGENSKDISINTPGTFTLRVEDNSGCSGESTVEVVAADDPIPQIIGNTTLCKGTATNLTTQVDYKAYKWSTGDTLETIPVNNAGTYFLTVTNSFGCTGINSFIITEAPDIQFNIIGNTSICAGASTILQADKEYLNYKWSTGADSSNISVNQTGNYALTVTDQSGCTGIATVEVSENSSLFPQIIGTTTLCGNAPTEISADADYASYSWSNGANSKSIIVTAADSYQVTVSNAAGCTGIASVEIDETPALMPNIIGSLSFCEGQSTTLSLDTPYSSYLWEGDIVRPSIEVLEEGAYTVTVTDANGCTGSTSVEVKKGALPPPKFIHEQAVICKGVEDVLIPLRAEDGYASYLWSNNGVGPSILVSEAQLYSVTVTDENGCTGVNTVEVLELPSPMINTGEPKKLCDGESISEELSLVGFDQYEWSTGDTVEAITVTEGGTYTVIVTNEFGCTGSGTYEVIEYEQPSLDIDNSLKKDTLGCSTDRKLILFDKAFDVDTYRWEDENGNLLDTLPILEITKGGTYKLTGTNSSTGCETVVEKTIVELENLVNVVATDSLIELNCRMPMGTIDVSASANADTYVWKLFTTDNFEKELDQITTDTHATREKGQYLVIGIDALSKCRDSTWIKVIDSSYDINPVVSGQSQLCENEIGQLEVVIDSTYENYLWTGGGTSRTIDISEARYYEVMVTDKNGCTGTGGHIVTEKALTELEVGLQKDQVDICEGTLAELDFLVQNNSGVGPFNVTVFDGETALPFNNIYNNEELMVSPTSTSSYSILDIVDLGNTCSFFNGTSEEVAFSIKPIPVANAVEKSSCGEQGTDGAVFDLDRIANGVKDSPNSSIRWYKDTLGQNPISSTSSFSSSSNSSIIYAKINDGICDSKPVPITLKVGDCSTSLEFDLEVGMDLDLSDLSGNRREVYITNRWGDLVYATKDYEGTLDKFNGASLPQGAYYIYIKNQEKENDVYVPYKGIIYLLK